MNVHAQNLDLGNAPEKSQALSLRQSLLLQLVTAIAATAVAVTTAGWTLRGMLSDRDTRLTVLEIHREDDTDRLKDIQQQGRDELDEMKRLNKRLDELEARR